MQTKKTFYNFCYSVNNSEYQKSEVLLWLGTKAMLQPMANHVEHSYFALIYRFQEIIYKIEMGWK